MNQEIFAIRNFSVSYIILDSVFILLLLGILLVQKKKMTFLWSLFGGILYFIVDYYVFYKLLGSRTIYLGGELLGDLGTCGVLLWMSLSYGITNFLWIWLCLNRDRDLKEWSMLIFGWWFCCPMIAEKFLSTPVQTIRSTGSYHGAMAIILFLSYLLVIFYNYSVKDGEEEKKVDILRLCIIGVVIQFAWEFGLLIGGIRSSNADITAEMKIRTLVVNSLLETNLGMPLAYVLHRFFYSRFTEGLKRK